jgi:type IV secretory pathway VirB4 component
MSAAAPLLAFVAGAAVPAALERLREHRREPQGLPDLLGWLHLVAPGTVLQKSGSFLAGWSYRGPDLAAATAEELDALGARLNDALLPYGDGWMFHVDFVRRPAQGYAPPGAFPDAVTRAIDGERRAAYESWSSHFVSESFLCATFLPAREVYSRLAELFVQGRPRARSAWAGLHARFEEEAAQLERRLSAHLKVARLSSRQLLGHLHACLTGLLHPVEPPPHGAYLDSLLADRALAGGWAPRIGDLHLRLLALHGFPHASFPGILDFLGGLGFSFRASHRIVPLSQATGARQLARLRLSWFKRRRGAASWLRELAASQQAAAAGGARERDDELFLDQDAAGMARDAAAAAAENASGRVRFCLYTPVVVVADADAGRADQLAAELLKALNDRGFTARLEDVNALEALCGSLPGNGFANLRRPLVSTRNLADLLPVTSVWPGLPENPSPLFPRHSPALLWAATTGATPFWLNLHDDDVGHTLVVGATGAGKSTLLNLLIAQFLRYPRAQVFAFDAGYSGWLLAQAAGARHYDLAVEAVRLQPLREIDRPGERLWALDWLEAVLAVNGVALTPGGRQTLDAALQLLATEPPAHRRLSDLLPQVQDRELAAALAPYAGGPLAHLLDAGEDDLGVGGGGHGDGDGGGRDGGGRGVGDGGPDRDGGGRGDARGGGRAAGADGRAEGAGGRAGGGADGSGAAWAVPGGGAADRAGGVPYQVFELKRLAEMEDRALLPVLLYLFHRVEQRLEQGRPSLLVIEEAWLPLMKSAFASRIKQWLLTLRKQNAAVVLATQSLSQLWESPHRHVLLESCPTRILLPNPEAASPAQRGLYRDLGLNDAEVQLLARATRKRDYYFKSPRGSRLFELGLGPLALAFVGTPEGMTQAEAIAEARPLIARHGAAWPREWLARRGVTPPGELAAAGPAAAGEEGSRQ